MEDFNEIISQDEKAGATLKPYRQMEIFREALEDCGLSDLGFEDSKYTWCNGREVQCSNHNPLLISFAILSMLANPKREYSDMRLTGQGRENVLTSLSKLRPVIAEKREKIKELQRLNQGELSESIKEVQKDVDNFLEAEDLKWCQRAKQRWFKDGDRNTQFIHSYANQRKKSNSILSISNEDGVHATQPKEVSDLFQAFYMDVFTTSQPQGIKDSIAHLGKTVTAEMNSQLLNEFTSKEI
ncbi:uncharacterized protein LOC109020477 [Juglans regia]|uniref:Uncharacterized protein LOC109020477 n=1 Tax=Juglans regia TaxID=51240 RepID=A0A6P9ER25_JUGRE|nr:uncharacterized protein LOC109020477 [Juglans regia]